MTERSIFQPPFSRKKNTGLAKGKKNLRADIKKSPQWFSNNIAMID
jgi:hypothetical protein